MVGAYPTFAWRDHPAVGGDLGGGEVEMYTAPLACLGCHVGCCWKRTRGSLSEDTEARVYGSGRVPQESPCAHALVGGVPLSGLHHQVNSPHWPMWVTLPLLTVPSKYSPVG